MQETACVGMQGCRAPVDRCPRRAAVSQHEPHPYLTATPRRPALHVGTLYCPAAHSKANLPEKSSFITFCSVYFHFIEIVFQKAGQGPGTRGRQMSRIRLVFTNGGTRHWREGTGDSFTETAKSANGPLNLISEQSS